MASMLSFALLTLASLSLAQTPVDASFPPSCPDSDGKQYVSPAGEVFQIYCGYDFNTADGLLIQPILYQVSDLAYAVNYCGDTFSPACTVFNLQAGAGVRMYTNVTASPPDILKSPPLSAADAVGVLISTTPPAGYFGCPTINNQAYTDGTGNTYNLRCGTSITGGTRVQYLQYYSPSNCLALCSATAGCTAWVLSDRGYCGIYTGTTVAYFTQQWYTAGINAAVGLLPSSSITPSPTSTVSVSTTAPSLPPIPSGFSYVTYPDGKVFVVANSPNNGFGKVKRQSTGFMACLDLCDASNTCTEAIYGTLDLTCTLTVFSCDNGPPPANSEIGILVGTVGGTVTIPPCLTDTYFVTGPASSSSSSSSGSSSAVSISSSSISSTTTGGVSTSSVSSTTRTGGGRGPRSESGSSFTTRTGGGRGPTGGSRPSDSSSRGGNRPSRSESDSSSTTHTGNGRGPRSKSGSSSTTLTGGGRGLTGGSRPSGTRGDNQPSKSDGHERPSKTPGGSDHSRAMSPTGRGYVSSKPVRSRSGVAEPSHRPGSPSKGGSGHSSREPDHSHNPTGKGHASDKPSYTHAPGGQASRHPNGPGFSTKDDHHQPSGSMKGPGGHNGPEPSQKPEKSGPQGGGHAHSTYVKPSHAVKSENGEHEPTGKGGDHPSGHGNEPAPSHKPEKSGPHGGDHPSDHGKGEATSTPCPEDSQSAPYGGGHSHSTYNKPSHTAKPEKGDHYPTGKGTEHSRHPEHHSKSNAYPAESTTTRCLEDSAETYPGGHHPTGYYHPAPKHSGKPHVSGSDKSPTKPSHSGKVHPKPSGYYETPTSEESSYPSHHGHKPDSDTAKPTDSYDKPWTASSQSSGGWDSESNRTWSRSTTAGSQPSSGVTFSLSGNASSIYAPATQETNSASTSRLSIISLVGAITGLLVL